MTDADAGATGTGNAPADRDEEETLQQQAKRRQATEEEILAAIEEAAARSRLEAARHPLTLGTGDDVAEVVVEEVEAADEAAAGIVGAADREVVLRRAAEEAGGPEALLDEQVATDRPDADRGRADEVPSGEASDDADATEGPRSPAAVERFGHPVATDAARERLDEVVARAKQEAQRDEIRRMVHDAPVEDRIRTPEIDIDRPDLPEAPEDYLDLPEFEPVRPEHERGEGAADGGNGRLGTVTGPLEGILDRVAGLLSRGRGGDAADRGGRRDVGGDAEDGPPTTGPAHGQGGRTGPSGQAGGPGAGGVAGATGGRGLPGPERRADRPLYPVPDRSLVYLPKLRPEQTEEALYTLVDGYLYVRILWDDAIKEHVYQVLEPDLSRRERAVYRFVKETLVNTLDVDVDEMEREGLERYLQERLDELLYEYSLDLPRESELKLKYYVVRDFLGYGRIDVLMRDPLIEDISCDGPGVPVFIYHRKFESMKTNVVFADDDELDSFVIKLAQKCRKHISIADPVLDATMPDGSRLQATLGREVTTGGSTFTIRKFREDPLTPTTLIDYGTFDEDIVAYFWLAVQHGKSALFAGGTASGKTTSLNSVLLFIPPQMKIVSIEDTRELNLPHPNWIAGVTREGGAVSRREGPGEIDMYTLLREALRQRPEYIVVGEVRGDEAYTLFQAMATGHTTYSTMHADSVESAIHRLNNDPINVPKIMLKALDIVSVQVQTRVGGHRVRRCKQIVEVVGVDPHTDEILTNEVFAWDPTTDAFEHTGVSYVLEKIKHEKSMSDREMDEELQRRKEILRWMKRHGVEDYKDVARVVTSYYKDPATTIERVRDDLGVEEVTRGAARALEARPGAGTAAGRPAGRDGRRGQDRVGRGTTGPGPASLVSSTSGRSGTSGTSGTTGTVEDGNAAEDGGPAEEEGEGDGA